MQVHHIGYLVKRIGDAEESLKVLGYSEERAAEYDPIRDAVLSFWVNGSTRVELVEPAAESPLRPLLARYKNSPYHICYIADDIEKEQQRLEQAGYVMFREPVKAPCLEGKSVVFLMSPGAGMVELVEASDPTGKEAE